MADELEPALERLSRVALETGVRLAVAESLTGGCLAASLARAPEASRWFRGGIVAYAREVKHHLLGVPPGPVVSSGAATAMAGAAVRLLEADVAVAVTGVGGPGEQDGQAPGTVWMALRDGEHVHVRREQLSGSPAEVVDRTCAAAVGWLLQACLARAATAGRPRPAGAGRT